MQSAMCVNGALAPSASWASGAAFNWPERNCCGCGLAAALAASPPPPIGDGATTHGYTLHLGTYCRGADRTTKKDSAGACEAHASSRKVACAHFGGGVCRFTYTFLGLLKAESSGFQSFVRPGAADDKAALKAAAAEEAKAKAALTASVSPLQACGPPTPRVPPSFYMYDGPSSCGASASPRATPPSLAAHPGPCRPWASEACRCAEAIPRMRRLVTASFCPPRLSARRERHSSAAAAEPSRPLRQVAPGLDPRLFSAVASEQQHHHQAQAEAEAEGRSLAQARPRRRTLTFPTRSGFTRRSPGIGGECASQTALLCSWSLPLARFPRRRDPARGPRMPRG